MAENGHFCGSKVVQKFLIITIWGYTIFSLANLSLFCYFFMVKCPPEYSKIIVSITKTSCNLNFIWIEYEGWPVQKRSKFRIFWPQNWDKRVFPAQNDESSGIKLSFSKTHCIRTHLKPIFRIIKFQFHFFCWDLLRSIAQISGRLKNYHVSQKKLSRELTTFVCPKMDQFFPIYRGPIYPILVGGPNILFKIPKIGYFQLYIRNIGKNHKIWLLWLILYSFGLLRPPKAN